MVGEDTNKKKLMLVIAVVVFGVVSLAVGIKIMTNDGDGAGGNIAEASELRFQLDSTDWITSSTSTGTMMLKNIGTSSMKMRFEMMEQDQHFIYIINIYPQKGWAYADGQWLDISDYPSEYWSQWDQTIKEYKAQLDGWTDGDLTFVDSGTGAAIRIYNIEVNPSLPDSLFQPS